MTTKIPNRAVFLDRDGTIIEDNGHIASIKQVELYPFAVEALSMLQKEFLLFIVTNQSGVGLGEISLEAATEINRHVLSTLQAQGIIIRELYCCSHKRDDNCECIKPKPFFINKAREKHTFDISQSFTVGDHPHDVEFGNNAGAQGLYVLTGHGKKHQSEVPAGTQCFENLLQVVQWILGVSNGDINFKKNRILIG